MLLLTKNFKNKVALNNSHFKIKSLIGAWSCKAVGNKKGQVIVEYILLILVSTMMALLLINLVTVDPGKASPVFKYWENLLKAVGQDIST